jgi:hypothetical protein
MTSAHAAASPEITVGVLPYVTNTAQVLIDGTTWLWTCNAPGCHRRVGWVAAIDGGDARLWCPCGAQYARPIDEREVRAVLRETVTVRGRDELQRAVARLLSGDAGPLATEQEQHRASLLPTDVHPLMRL